MLTVTILFLVFNDWHENIVEEVLDFLQNDWMCFRIIFLESIKSYTEFGFGMIFLESD